MWNRDRKMLSFKVTAILPMEEWIGTDRQKWNLSGVLHKQTAQCMKENAKTFNHDSEILGSGYGFIQGR